MSEPILPNNSIKAKTHHLRPTCEKCFGLCCVALFFSEQDGFPIDKNAGTPCPHLESNFHCDTYDNLETLGLRFSRGERWTGILQDKLSDYYKPSNEFEIIEEGLAGRTMGSSSIREGRDGYTYLKPCLDSHNPLYSVILMLGVNELKKVNNKSSEEIGDMLEYRFVRPILEHLLLCGYLDEYESLDSYRKTHKLIIVCPPIVSEDNYNKCETNDKFLGATDKSKKLIDIYRKISEKYYCGFIDSNGLKTGCDGLHLDKTGHKKTS